MRKIGSKPCTSCGLPVEGIKRLDREAFRYPRRCSACRGKWLPSSIEKLRATLSQREFLPIGSRRTHDSGNGLIYWEIKTNQPNEWDYEHRVIMAKRIGRELESFEHVHHKNENTLDNSDGNLHLLLSSDHTREHLSLNGRWSLKAVRCIDCKTTDKKHVAHSRCTTCHQRWAKRLTLA